MVTTYSDEQREYWHKRPANVIQFMTVEFYHPDFGYIRLVANQFSDKQLDVNGALETFTASSMELPRVTNQSTDTTRAGTIIFGRVGSTFREKLMQITPMGAIKNPIQVTLRQYENGIVNPIYERRLYAAQDGIKIGAESVNVELSVDNPAKLTNEQAFYDVETWVGLQLG